MTFQQAYLFRGVLAASLIAGLGAVQAAPVTISNAAYAASYVRDCRDAGARTAGSTTPNRCEVGGNFGRTLVEVQDQVALGGFVASAAATNPLGKAGGQATRSTIDASGAAGTLTLKQGAFSGSSYARVSGHSLGLQSFLFTGATGEVRTIQNTLDFTSNVVPNVDFNDPGPAGSLLDPAIWGKTRVTVFSLASGGFDFDLDLGLSPQDLGFWEQASGRADYRWEAESNVVGITASGIPSLLSFTMETGRYYFVESYLGLWARFGGVFDATHTLTTTLGALDGNGAFAPTLAGFTPAAPSDNPVIISDGFGTVPEPATLPVVMLGLAIAYGLRRQVPTARPTA